MASATPTLGRLEKVDLRTIWTSEAGSFTPWLALEENIKLLGETIGLDLEVEAQEKNVGPFRADILCRETTTPDHWVLIENQLERTDHSHLGQIITYAAGLKAVTIVWVSSQFTDEHRAALDWLNDITDTRFRFFGLEVEAWRIGNSAPAPKFNVVSEPNEWVKQVGENAGRQLTEGQAIQVEFWTAFREYAETHARNFRATKPLPQHWMLMGLGRTGLSLSAIAAFSNSETNTYETHELRAEFQIQNKTADRVYANFEERREHFDKQFDEPLHWYTAEGVKTRRIYLRRDADLMNRDAWPEYHAWLTARLDRLYEVFQPEVMNLDPSLLIPTEESEAGSTS